MEDEGYNVAEPVTDPARLEEIAEAAEDAAEPTFEGSGGGDLEANGQGEESSGWSDLSEDVGEHEAGRDNAVGEPAATTGDEGSENAGSEGTAGDGEPIDVSISGQPIAVDVESFESYEGVTAQDFETYSQDVVARLDAIDAMMIVLMVAIFLCAGISAVDTLVRRFERN